MYIEYCRNQNCIVSIYITIIDYIIFSMHLIYFIYLIIKTL